MAEQKECKKSRWSQRTGEKYSFSQQTKNKLQGEKFIRIS
jgi:hypothetical protein